MKSSPARTGELFETERREEEQLMAEEPNEPAHRDPMKQMTLLLATPGAFALIYTVMFLIMR